MPSESLEEEQQNSGMNSEGRDNIGDLPEKMQQASIAHPDIKRSPSNRQLEMNLLKAQLEYCFSDEALAKDNYLLSRMLDHPDSSLYGYVPVSVLAGVQRIRSIDDDPAAIRKAVRESDFLELDDEKDMVHRPGYVPPRDFRFNRDLRRTVFLFGFPCSYTKDHVKRLVDVYGTVKRIHWYDPEKAPGNQDDEAPDLQMSIMLMQRRLPHLRPTGPDADSQASRSSAGEASTVDPELSARWAREDPDVSHLRAAYVVFHSQSQANKCVQSRRSFGEIRAITKYEFQKFLKKYEQAKESGEKFDVFPYPHNARHALSNANAGADGGQRFGGGGGAPRMSRPNYRRVVSDAGHGHRRPVVDMTAGRGPPRHFSKRRSDRRPPPVSVHRQRAPRVTSPRWESTSGGMYEPMSPIHNRHSAPKILVGDTLVDEEDLQNFIQLKRKLSSHPMRHGGSMSGPMRSPGYYSGGGRPRRASDGGPRRGTNPLDQTWPPRYSNNDWKQGSAPAAKPVAKSPLIRTASADTARRTKPARRPSQ